MKRDINKDDFECCAEIIKSWGVTVISYDNVWSTMFFKTDDWSLSLGVLNDINEDLKEKTEFYLFSNSVDKGGSKTLTLCVGFKDNYKRFDQKGTSSN